MPMDKEQKGKKSSFLRGVLKCLLWIAGILVALTLLIMCTVAWILTPERLTPIVRNLANGHLDADVGIGKVELTVWSTFPHLNLSVDSLTVRSRAFDGLSASEMAKLPESADTLLRIGHFGGSLNVPALLAGSISLSDFKLASAKVNVVVYDAETANFNIVASDTVDEESPGRMFIPDININRFDILDELPVSYYSVPDSMRFAVTIAKSPLVVGTEQGYRVDLSGGVDMFLSPELRYDGLNVALNGHLKWSLSNPEKVVLEDFLAGVGDVSAKFNTEIDLDEPLTVKSFELSMDEITPSALLSTVPDCYRKYIGTVDSDMKINVGVVLDKPYVVGDTVLPSVDLNFSIPDCKVVYDGKYRIDNFGARGSVDFDGADIDNTVVNIERLRLAAYGGSISLKGRFSDLTSNPRINASVRADVDCDRLPKPLKEKSGGELSGKIEFDSDVKMRMSDLNAGGFHRIFLKGKLGLKDVSYVMCDSFMSVYAHDALFRLGTNSSFANDSARVDSLLTASVRIDTLSLGYGGMNVQLKDALVGAGCQNKRGADSTVVVPFGAVLKVGGLSYSDADSARVRLGGVSWRAVLRRYEHQKNEPLLQLFGDVDRAFCTDRFNYMMLHKGHVDVSAHLRKRRQMPPRIKAKLDSVMERNPGISSDSAVAVLRKEYLAGAHRDSSAADNLDFGVDDNVKKLLRRWDVSGHVMAERGGMFTPYFPIRNRISHFDMSFSTDSIVLKDVRYDAGRSDFVINGSVCGISRALTRGTPLSVNLSVKSDTLNVNELVQASFVGASYAEKISSGRLSVESPVDDSELDSLADAAGSSEEIGPLLVPMNLRAAVNVDADNIVYSDMLMHDFNGMLLMNEGALTLRNLSAASDIGSARMTALYVAPSVDDMHFGMGLQLNGIKVKEFIGMIPAIDSLMPLLSSFEGVIDADMAVTSQIDSTMNIMVPSLDAAVKLSGKDLVLLDAETFRTLAKWLMFKDKKITGNKIDDMTVELVVKNSTVELFPFVFDFDRYRMAVMGSNDLNLNYKYHISVLKSPLPFKFGINISGNPDNMKVRLGGAKHKPGQAGERMAIVDTTRINLIKEIDRVFQRGARSARLGSLKVKNSPVVTEVDSLSDTISARDSLVFIKEGLIEAPKDSIEAGTLPTDVDNKKKR